MNESSLTLRKRHEWLAWSTRDILLMATVSVSYGILLAVLIYPYALSLFLGPIFEWVWVGLYILPGFFVAYTLRRAGSAFIVAMLYSLVMIPFTPYGAVMLITGLVYAASAEIGIVLVTRYRYFSLPIMLLSGFASAIAMLIIYVIFWPTSFNYALPIVIGIIATTIACGVIAAFIAKQLADALARTGVLSGTALKNKDIAEV